MPSARHPSPRRRPGLLGRFSKDLLALIVPAAAVVAGVGLLGCAPNGAKHLDSGEPLQPPSAFAAVADDAERSQAMFAEAARVLLHPRCVNCHPSDDSPRQLDSSRMHVPRVTRGTKGDGAAGLRCASCHQSENLSFTRVPGAPHWQLAPIEMAWFGKTPREVCEQLKDPARNGGRDADALVEHMRTDPLVAWGWDPGADRAPVPGDQNTFADLIRAWLDTGAVCPPDTTTPGAAS